MSTIASGIFKTVAAKRQTGLGVIAANTTGTSQYMRRVTSTLDIGKKNYSSNEILPSQQQRDMRLGVVDIAGQISGELSVGGYQAFTESICRQAAQAISSTGGIVTVTAAFVSGSKGTFTRSAGSFITDGFNIGDVISWSGWVVATANNAHRMVISNLTATVMTCYTLDGAAIVARAAGDSVACVTAGKKIWVPITGQTRDYYTIEHFFGDISQSEVFTDCVPTQVDLKAPGSGLVTIAWTFMGLGYQNAQAQYFIAPAAPPTGTIAASVNGNLIINNTTAGVITGIDVSIKGSHWVPGGVVGSNFDPDVIPGKVLVSGQITVLFTDNVMRDLFLNETESALTVVLTANSILPTSPFTAINMSRIKFSGQKKDDGEKGLTLTLPFVALENYAAGGAAFANLDTTISIQDSAFA